MAITSAGVGSGLDIESLITKLVAADRSAPQSRITNRQSTLNTQLSAIGTVKSLLSNVQTKLDALTQDGALAALTASSSDESLFTASAGSGAVAGSYELEVVSLAKASKQISSAISGGGDTVMGAGDITIASGGHSFTVTLGSTDNTLANLRDAINRASDNPGVTASLITESGGTHLLLTANETGADHQITVSSSLMSFSEKQPGVDAHLRVEGYDVYSGSNTVTDAIDGVTLNLQAAKAGTTNTLSVATDNGGIQTALNSFIGVYNTAMATLRSMSAYNADAKTAGALNGDSLVRGAIQQLRAIVGSTVSGAGRYSSLADLGISADETGKLSLNSSSLSTALSTDASSVKKLFTVSGGYGTQLDGLLNSLVGDNGSIDSRQTSLQTQLSALDDEQDRLDARMTADEARYRKQYTALDSLLSQMNTTSSFLTQQLTAIANLSSGSSSKSG